MESEEIPYVSMEVRNYMRQHEQQQVMFQEIPYFSMDTKEDMLRNSIRQHGHKIRNVKEIPYVSMIKIKAC